MSRPRRHSPGGMVFHVLNRGVGRRVLFTKDEDFLAFERVVEETLRTRRMGVRLLFDAQPLAFRRLARAGWRSSRVHAASDQHACETVEGASSRDRVRPSLSRALQVFPGGNRRLLLPGRSLRGAECPACKPRGASGIVALVEFAPCGARRHGVPHPLGVAFASPHRLAATCQPAANGSRSGGVVVLRQSRSVLRRSQLGHRHGRAIGAGMDDSASWKTEDRRNNHKACHSYLCSPDLVAVTFPLPVQLGPAHTVRGRRGSLAAGSSVSGVVCGLIFGVLTVVNAGALDLTGSGFRFDLTLRGSNSLGTTSSSVSTSRNVRSALTSGGSSTRSFSLCRGMSNVRIPARRAARILSRTPPTGSTRPVSVTSPVIASSVLMGSSRNRLMSAAAMATPAEGPSLGTAPAGTWMCTSVLLKREASRVSVLA